MKAGGGFLYNRLNILFPGAVRCFTTFSSLNNFLTGNYISYQQAFGVPEQAQSNPNFGLFVQDEWRVRPDFTINAGLRYDAQFLPDPIQTDANNLSPRLRDRLRTRRPKNSDTRKLWPLLRSHSAAGHFQRLATRWVEVHRRAIVADTTRRSCFSKHAVGPTGHARNAAQHHAHRSEHRGELQPARKPANRTRTAGQHDRLGWLPASARASPDPLAKRERAYGSCVGWYSRIMRPDPNWGNISRFESSGNSSYDGMVVS